MKKGTPSGDSVRSASQERSCFPDPVGGVGKASEYARPLRLRSVRQRPPPPPDDRTEAGPNRCGDEGAAGQVKPYQIAKQTRADHKTVGTVRAELEGRGEIPHVAKVTDTKGRKQPVRKATQPRTPVGPSCGELRLRAKVEKLQNQNAALQNQIAEKDRRTKSLQADIAEKDRLIRDLNKENQQQDFAVHHFIMEWKRERALDGLDNDDQPDAPDVIAEGK